MKDTRFQVVAAGLALLAGCISSPVGTGSAAISWEPEEGDDTIVAAEVRYSQTIPDNRGSRPVAVKYLADLLLTQCLNELLTRAPTDAYCATWDLCPPSRNACLMG